MDTSPSPVARLRRTSPILLGGFALVGPFSGPTFAGDPEPAAPSEPLPVAAEEGDETDFLQALKNGRGWLELNLRWETASSDDVALPEDSNAVTLRTTLGYETAEWNDFRGVLEFQDVAYLTSRSDTSGPGNPNPGYPPILDPRQTGVSNAYLGWTGLENTDVKIGRQYTRLDNQRFVGPVPWRQFYQTFDSVSIFAKGLGPIELFGSYIGRQNSAIGSSFDMDTGLLNLAYPIESWGRLVLYGYYLDYDAPNTVNSSTMTAGARFAGERAFESSWDLLYAAEYANQTEIGSNTGSVDADYIHGELGAKLEWFSLMLGTEILGGASGSETNSFQTPLATKHKFNGWADRFLVTPIDGLNDLYGWVGVPIGPTNFKFVYHDFSAEQGSADYGSELDFLLTWKATEELTFAAKYATYDAENNRLDGLPWNNSAQRGWIWASFSF